VSRSKLGRIPPASNQNVRKVMQSNRGRDTGPEVALRRGLRQAGLGGYQINYRIGRKRLDISYPSHKVAVLVHGCFWHNCPSCNLPIPKSHTAYWRRKFSINKLRDEETFRQLRAEGWLVTQFWEHELTASVTRCVARVARVLKTRMELTGEWGRT
jgi:DNA mismatch endonuclease (patch repair protein)